MEPLVQYSQRDPLYDSNKLIINTDSQNDLSKQDDLLTENNHLSETVYNHNYYAKQHGGPVYYQPEPEPIIEIIIKDANISLPAVPVPTQAPKKKEPVQVFYVKYKKNPHGTGKDSVIYDTPIPAITPPVHDDEPHHQIDKPQEYVTLPPLPSTTIRTIIRPESETFIGTKGIHVTFGSEKKKHDKPHVEGHEESAPQPAVIFPRQENAGPFPPQHFDNSNPRASFPPNFPPATNNFNNQPPSSSRTFPSFNQPPKFTGSHVRPPFGSFSGPPSSNSFKSGPPGQQNRSFPGNFPPQRPPAFSQSLPSVQQRQPFNNQGPPFNNHGPSFGNQGPPFSFNNHQENPNGPFRQPPLPQQPPRIPVSQITFTQKPPTHFPIPQQPLQHINHHQQQPFNQKPQGQNEPRPPNFAQQPHVNFQQHINHQVQPNNQVSQHKPQATQPGPPQALPLSLQEHPLPHRQQFQAFNPQPSTQHASITQNQHSGLPQHPPLIQHTPANPQISNIQNQQPLHNSHNQFSNQPSPAFHQPNPNQQQNFNVQNQQISHQFNPHNGHPQHNGQIQNNEQIHNIHNGQQTQNGNFQQSSQIPQFSQPNFNIPPGGELVKSVPKYEQHLSIPASNTQINQQNLQQSQQTHQQSQSNLPQSLPLVQSQPQQNQLNQHQQQQAVSFNYNAGIQSSAQIHQQPQVYQPILSQSPHESQFKPQKDTTQHHVSQQTQQARPLTAQEYQQHLQQQYKNYATQTTTSKITTTQAQQQNQQNFQNNQQQFFTQHLPKAQAQSPQSQTQQQFSQSHSFHNQYSTQRNIPPLFQTTPRNGIVPYSSTSSKATTTSTTTTTTTQAPTKNSLPSNIVLPDEVPDDLRQQLIESGILDNAQISILDYDKIGDTPLESLPADQLANFYGAGGAQQLAASEQKIRVVDTSGKSVNSADQDPQASVQKEDKSNKKVEMKVVRFDPNTPQGQAIPEAYVKDDATQVDPVVLNDDKYNRYLPLKVSGAQFPIPDVPELRGKKVASVVVLAPVDYEFKSSKSQRTARDVEGDIREVRFLSGGYLKQLLEKPNSENYKRWLKQENETASEKQSVVLLVTE